MGLSRQWYVQVVVWSLIVWLDGAAAVGSDYEAVKLMKRYAPRIVEEEYNGGATDITPKLIDYVASSTHDAYVIRMHIRWKGILSGDVYEATGDLDVTPQGWSWSQTSVNNNLRAWLLFRGGMNALANEIEARQQRQQRDSSQDARTPPQIFIPPPRPPAPAPPKVITGNTGSNCTSATSVSMPNTKPGDTYIFESLHLDNPKLSNTTERKVVSVSDGKLVLAYKNPKSESAKARIVQFTPEWNLISSRNLDGSGFDYSPPLKYFEFPLCPGKTWRQTSRETNIKSGEVREHTFSATVGDWENISVTAGTFRALRITIQKELLDSTGEKKSTGTEISWYVPDIRRSVKTEITSQNLQEQPERQFIQLIQHDIK
jgi:hypothetical protein